MLLGSGEGRDQGIWEIAEYPAPPTQRLVSGAVSLVSLILFVRAIGPEPALQDAAPFLLLASATFIAVFLRLFREFRDVRRAVVEGKPYVKRAGIGRPCAIIWALFILAAILGPFMLSAYLQPVAWFSAVLGLTSGFSSSQLVFILYVRSWEKSNDVKLEQYRVLLYGGEGRLVVERGVRARR